jgi:nucleoside-diphosphate-sugar epimerase
VDDLIPLTKAFIDLSSGNGIKSVIIDNLYMYGRKYNEPLREDMEPLAQSRKGKIRAEITELYLKAHKEGKISVIICRASDFYGPRVINSTMGARIMTKVLQGKKIAVLYNPDVPHSFSFVNDYAKAVINLVGSEDVFGQIWHIPTAEPITQREFLEIALEIANKTPKITSLSNFMLNMVALFNPIVKEIKELSYQFEKPFIMDHSKYEKRFGLDITPHKKAIETTLEWYEKEYLN